MANRYLGSTPFADMLANSIAEDSQIQAAAETLDGMLDKTLRLVPDILVYARLVHASGMEDPTPMLPPLTRLCDLSGGPRPISSGLLNLISWQLHVEGGEDAIDDPAKLCMIMSSLVMHRRRGTPWAVRNALETALGVPAWVKQWFEYGGKPYFFRVRLDVTGNFVDLNWLLSAFRLIMEYKNVRSWLEWLETFSTTILDIFEGVGVAGRTIDQRMLFFPPPPMPQMFSRVGIGVHSHTRFKAGTAA